MRENKIKENLINRKKNKKKREYNKKSIIFSLLIISIFLAELYSYAWCRVQCVKIGYSISEATKEKEKSVALQERLNIELERLKSPNRIIYIAKTQFGLHMPEQSQIVQIP